jgi:signal transduction histidine kinase
MASLGQLSAGIAHEINNPLAFVSSNINRLNEYFRDVIELLGKWQNIKSTLPNISDFNMMLQEIDEFSERIELDFILQDFDRMMISIQDGNQRIKKIVEGMRGFTHLSDSSLAGANINQAIEDTLTIVWNEIKYKATIEKNYGDFSPVTCNIVEIKQVLVNLLVNAAQAIEEKGVIKVSTNVSDGYLYIKIEDSGSGIPEEKIKRIFDPFFTTKPVGKGTGLGLWISSSIIEKHSGTITVESKVGTGSLFIVKLPVVQQTANTKSEVMTI